MLNESRKNPSETQAAAQATKPRSFVIDDTLYWQAKSGEELKLNLDFPQTLLREAMSSVLSDLEQFDLILSNLGDKATIAKVKAMGALELSRLVNTFLSEFQKAVDAPLGKSESSSDS